MNKVSDLTIDEIRNLPAGTETDKLMWDAMYPDRPIDVAYPYSTMPNWACCAIEHYRVQGIKIVVRANPDGYVASIDMPDFRGVTVCDGPTFALAVCRSLLVFAR